MARGSGDSSGPIGVCRPVNEWGSNSVAASEPTDETRRFLGAVDNAPQSAVSPTAAVAPWRTGPSPRAGDRFATGEKPPHTTSQPMQNVAAFKTVTVGVQTGVSNVISNFGASSRRRLPADSRGGTVADGSTRQVSTVLPNIDLQRRRRGRTRIRHRRRKRDRHQPSAADYPSATRRWP